MEKTFTSLLREIEVPMKKRFTLPIWLRNTFAFLSIIGPGIITASADNDAPGIATYSVAGSKYGYSFIWIILVITIGEVIIQEMAARMGAVTGKGAADLIRERLASRRLRLPCFAY